RGGGEYGEDWHRAGMQGNKQNVFDDFYACAEWLVANKYTTSTRLAIEGGSNGGLLTGVATTQRPELFAAAIIAVPLLDMVRFQDFLIARYWTPEYGSSEDAAQFQTLYAYSPYHNIKKDQRYPAMLVTAGENDSRVHPLHARKFVARMQAMSSNKVAQDPIMLWVDREAGHGQGKPLALRIRDEVDQWSFVMSQTGACR
ncbi:MAG: S9 family peptidase, partial [Planctomycetota bacterium]